MYDDVYTLHDDTRNGGRYVVDLLLHHVDYVLSKNVHARHYTTYIDT